LWGRRDDGMPSIAKRPKKLEKDILSKVPAVIPHDKVASGRADHSSQSIRDYVI